MKKGTKSAIIICIMLAITSVFPIVITSAASDESTIYVDDDAPPEWYDTTHVKTTQEGNAPEYKSINKLYDTPSNGIWFVRGLFKFLDEDEEYIYLKAISAKLRGFGNGVAVYHLFFCPIKISKPFYGFLTKDSLPLPGIGICREWDYIEP